LQYIGSCFFAFFRYFFGEYSGNFGFDIAMQIRINCRFSTFYECWPVDHLRWSVRLLQLNFTLAQTSSWSWVEIMRWQRSGGCSPRTAQKPLKIAWVQKKWYWMISFNQNRHDPERVKSSHFFGNHDCFSSFANQFCL